MDDIIQPRGGASDSMTHTAGAHPLPLSQRIAGAFPDSVTAGIFLYAWIAPVAWHRTLVADLMLVMLIEFILIHSAPFLGSIVLASGESEKKRFRAFAGFTFFYSLFIGAFAVSFKTWWPVIAFTWLIGAKLVSLFSGREHTARDKQRMMGYWGASVVYYLLAVFATLFLPVPELGITLHGSAYGIPGSGAWVSHPHIVVAAGFLYFVLLAVTKLFEKPTWWRNIKQGVVNRT